jgi:ABC-type cobalamin/Fe3+-siderophores transport system ATPase subunit
VAPNTPLLRARGILPPHVSWKRHFDLDLTPGEIVAILGPNGVGKSTLLSTIVGAATPIEGTCTVDNVPIGHLHGASRRAALAFLSQHDPTPSGFLVREHVALGSRAIDSQRDALQDLGLVELAERRIETLSGGETRRCSLAAAIAQDSRCLIADEPTNHMDPEWVARTGELLKDLADRKQKAILVVLHDIPLARRIADRIVQIEPDGPVG